MLERLSWFMIVPAIPIFIILNSISGKIGFNDTIHTAYSQQNQQTESTQTPHNQST
jgi:hypothetical protein